jgi:hypothetical protein
MWVDRDDSCRALAPSDEAYILAVVLAGCDRLNEENVLWNTGDRQECALEEAVRARCLDCVWEY